MSGNNRELLMRSVHSVAEAARMIVCGLPALEFRFMPTSNISFTF